jgi:hypothetical protein
MVTGQFLQVFLAPAPVGFYRLLRCGAVRGTLALSCGRAGARPSGCARPGHPHPPAPGAPTPALPSPGVAGGGALARPVAPAATAGRTSGYSQGGWGGFINQLFRPPSPAGRGWGWGLAANEPPSALAGSPPQSCVATGQPPGLPLQGSAVNERPAATAGRASGRSQGGWGGFINQLVMPPSPAGRGWGWGPAANESPQSCVATGQPQGLPLQGPAVNERPAATAICLSINLLGSPPLGEGLGVGLSGQRTPPNQPLPGLPRPYQRAQPQVGAGLVPALVANERPLRQPLAGFPAAARVTKTLPAGTAPVSGLDPKI